MTGGVSAAVSAQRSLGIELLEALLVRGNATVSPYLLALKIQRRTDAVITVSIVVGARISVLLVDVRRALTGLAGAHFRKIAFVGRFPAHDATREQLHFQNRSRLDLSRGSSTPKQWFRSVERKRNLDLPIYLPSSSLYTPSVRFHLSTRLLYSWLSGTYIFRQRGGRMEAWNVWRGTYPRCWSTIEIGKLRSERGEERGRKWNAGEIFYLTIAAARAGRALRFGGESAGDRIAAGVVLVTLLDRSAITLLSLVDYPVSARSPYFHLKKGVEKWEFSLTGFSFPDRGWMSITRDPFM